MSQLGSYNPRPRNLYACELVSRRVSDLGKDVAGHCNFLPSGFELPYFSSQASPARLRLGGFLCCSKLMYARQSSRPASEDPNPPASIIICLTLFAYRRASPFSSSDGTYTGSCTAHICLSRAPFSKCKHTTPQTRSLTDSLLHLTAAPKRPEYWQYLGEKKYISPQPGILNHASKTCIKSSCKDWMYSA